MKAMADALEISETNLSSDKDGQFVVIGKSDKPLRLIQRLDNEYFYYIKATSTQKCSSMRKKLVSFGMTLHMQRNEEAYLFMRRVPETELEASTIRSYLGIKQKATKNQRKKNQHSFSSFGEAEKHLTKEPNPLPDTALNPGLARP